MEPLCDELNSVATSYPGLAGMKLAGVWVVKIDTLQMIDREVENRLVSVPPYFAVIVWY